MTVASLKTRVREAMLPAARQDRPLFPLSIVERYLLTHPIVTGLALLPCDVHAALLDVHTRINGRLSTEGEEKRRGNRSPRRCIECRQGYVEVDSHEGQEVCSHCGLVQTRHSINIEPEYNAPPDVSRNKRPRQQHIPGVPVRLVQSLASSVVRDPSHRRSVLWGELEHWNAHTHLSPDQLRFLDALLKEWTGGAHSKDVRVAAALLYLPLRTKFPDELDVRNDVHSHRQLTEIRTTVPPAEFSCRTCNAKCFRKKDARFHCRAGRPPPLAGRSDE